MGLPPKLATSLGRLHKRWGGQKDLGVGLHKHDAVRCYKGSRTLTLKFFAICYFAIDFTTQVSNFLIACHIDSFLQSLFKQALLFNMSGAQVIVVYPRKDTSTFDKEYYLSTHMPLVAKHWKKHGFKSYTVTELNADGPYSFSVVMEFESAEGWGAAATDPNTKEVMDDVPKFSNESPVIVHGGVISQEKV
jgi:uncharacterized protein (TIGR02118 family)